MARFLLTAGPTREPIDPVRFLSNRSSGRMGYSLAAVLAQQGHQVVLVSGPVALSVPVGVRRIEVETAVQMMEACQSEWASCDGLFAVAAVADYRPKTILERKYKRGSEDAWSLQMVANPDILATLAQNKGERLVVGFAVETHDAESEAVRKLKTKHLDYLILNGAEAQGAKKSSVELFAAAGWRRSLGPALKQDLALALVELILGPHAAH